MGDRRRRIARYGAAPDRGCGGCGRVGCPVSGGDDRGKFPCAAGCLAGDSGPVSQGQWRSDCQGSADGTFFKMNPQPLTIAGVQFTSRLFVGTGKYSSGEVMGASLAATGTQLVTVALRRVRLDGTPDEIISHLEPGRYRLLPNTSGVRDAKEAILAAELAREALE